MAADVTNCNSAAMDMLVDGITEEDSNVSVEYNSCYVTVELLTYQRFCQCRDRFRKQTNDNQLVSLLIDHFVACQGSHHLLTDKALLTKDFKSVKNGQVSTAIKFALSNSSHAQAAEEQDDSDGNNYSDVVCKGNTSAMLSCPICGALCNSNFHFQQHVSEHVSIALYPFSCVFCGSKFTNWDALELHRLSFHNFNSSPLELHLHNPLSHIQDIDKIAQYTSPSRFLCQCGQRFQWPSKLCQHMRVCASQQSQRQVLQTSVSSPQVIQTCLPIQQQTESAVQSAKEVVVSESDASEVDLPVASDDDVVVEESVADDDDVMPTCPATLVGSCPMHLCPECGTSFDSIDALGSHIDSEHASVGCFACLCGQTFEWKPAYLRHLLQCIQVIQHGTWRPLLHSVLAEQGAEPPAHIVSIVKDTPSTPLRNEACKPLSSSVDKPRFRINRTNQEKPYECLECHKCFRTKTLLDQHGHLHRPPKYQCRYCAKRYRWPPVFYSHQRTCKYQFMSVSSVSADVAANKDTSPSPGSAHLPTALLMAGVCASGAQELIAINKSSESPSASAAAPEAMVKTRLPLNYSDYVCACGGKFHTYRLYTAHMAECTAVAGPAAAAAAVVGLSGQTAGPGSALAAATAVVGDLSVLNVANLGGQVGGGGGSVDNDRQERHVCPQCGKTYSSKFSLKQHIDGMHSAEGKFECPSCKKRFRWGASYYYHKKACVQGGSSSKSAADLSVQMPSSQLQRQIENTALTTLNSSIFIKLESM